MFFGSSLADSWDSNCDHICGTGRSTKGLRYYPKAYVQEFAAEAISFLLRNASMKQLIKGILSGRYLIERLGLRIGFLYYLQVMLVNPRRRLSPFSFAVELVVNHKT